MLIKLGFHNKYKLSTAAGRNANELLGSWDPVHSLGFSGEQRCPLLFMDIAKWPAS